ncbi:glycosyltransferase family 4 protein [Methanoplanus sp. FWC-SCC4]|uniref:Glycosyltransferase family 4 protein n=1 Tax=Methanochimaera problematica TaxID=2609417 RepID=A0AA97FDD3_9EURY|nr:glycosyltransferase family 4 protein [Methanoplanus sp. FWC-SCC4]WOF15396.1 glycosyltransferase family 4 protein [Methanoplanus sp. FWC-SCC4]
MPRYTLGLFANLYPAYEGDSRGIFVKRMVDDLEREDIRVIKAVKKSTSPLAYFPFYADSLFKTLDKNIDILQAEYIPHSSIIPCLMKSKRPLILKFHGDDGLIYPFKNKFNRALIDFSLNRADHIITCSEALKRSIVSLGVEPEKITPIANGVDTTVFRPMDKEKCRNLFSLDPDATICLFAGRLHPMKGIYEIIESAKINPDVTFVFGGPGVVPDHPKNCIFLGDISPDAMPQLMNTADFLVLPSHSEGLGLVLIESLACGVPVIASNVGGCPEIVKNEHSGILVQSGDYLSLSNAVSYMNQNPDDRKIMGKHGRKDIMERYDAKKMSNLLISIHEKYM